jgi:hypothetical protein
LETEDVTARANFELNIGGQESNAKGGIYQSAVKCTLGNLKTTMSDKNVTLE